MANHFRACDGLQAVRKAAEMRPDIILLDVGMPILNGIEAARKIRQVSPHSKIVFLTQNTDNEVISEALATYCLPWRLFSATVIQPPGPCFSLDGNQEAALVL
jgi:CheY-like chemotaxis protein